MIDALEALGRVLSASAAVGRTAGKATLRQQRIGLPLEEKVRQLLQLQHIHVVLLAKQRPSPAVGASLGRGALNRLQLRADPDH